MINSTICTENAVTYLQTKKCSLTNPAEIVGISQQQYLATMSTLLPCAHFHLLSLHSVCRGCKSLVLGTLSFIFNFHKQQQDRRPILYNIDRAGDDSRIVGLFAMGISLEIPLSAISKQRPRRAKINNISMTSPTRL
ncbi:hypothetical protein CIPAW_10G050100 [Carya illinoinensis]|uniref:Uncharacterized protein n=1 Tax=Carya illinoinensis TaxID=32201 RepID=A0A8T1PAC9_CARIL|nr:hypothetical protein CIPAW_10G050100 [Carya illinoinensis]